MPYLTPDYPVTGRVISVLVPDNFEPYFWGALSDLLHPEHWEEYGEMTPEEAAMACMALMQEAESLPVAILPPGAVSGQFLASLDPGTNTLQWKNPTLSPPDGLAYVEIISAMHSYTFWVEPVAGEDPAYVALTDGIVSATISGGEDAYVHFPNTFGYLAIVFDFGTPVLVFCADAYGMVIPLENIIYPTALALYYSDDNANFYELNTSPSPEPIGSIYRYHLRVENDEPMTPHRYWIVTPFVTTGSDFTALSEVELHGVKIKP